MSAPDGPPEFALVAAVALLHERGWEGVRIAANFYATGHWRCRVYVPWPGDPTGPGDERDVLLAYSSGAGADVFRDGRTAWTPAQIADRLAAAAAEHPHAARPDPAYAAWVRELRARTGGGAFVMHEDAYTPQQMWHRRGLVSLLFADPAIAAADDALPGHDAVDENGWSLRRTMPAPPAP